MKRSDELPQTPMERAIWVKKNRLQRGSERPFGR